MFCNARRIEGSYKENARKRAITAIKSWLRHLPDVEIRRKIKITNADATPTLEEERVPEGLELAEIFSRVKLRTGSMISPIAKSGLRPQTLGNKDATDGLMIRNLPDLVIRQGRPQETIRYLNLQWKRARWDSNPRPLAFSRSKHLLPQAYVWYQRPDPR